MVDEAFNNDSISICSTDSENYGHLLLAFHVTHMEASRIIVIGNKLKSENKFLE